MIILPTTAIYVMFYYIGTRCTCIPTEHEFYLGLLLMLVAVYSISLLATLNARESLRMQAERIGHVSLPHLSSVSCKASGKRLATVVRYSFPLLINVMF